MTTRTTSRSRLTVLPAIIVLWSLPRVGLAEAGSPPPPPEAAEPAGDNFDAVVARAVEEYNGQHYDEAIRLFRQAYTIQPQTELIYNIARVLERAVRREEAVAEYERYLALPNTTADLRNRAINSLEALRNELEALARAQHRETTPQTPTSPPPPPPRERDLLNPLGWAFLGVGAAVLITGGVFGGLALSEQSATEDATNRAEQDLHLQQGQDYAMYADILFGVGGAFALTGTILLILRALRHRGGDEEEPTESQVSWRPFLLGGQGLGLTLDGRF